MVINHDIKIFIRNLNENKQPLTIQAVKIKLDELQRKILSPEIITGIKKEFEQWLVSHTD